MAKVLITGNDLSLGLPTRYSDVINIEEIKKLDQLSKTNLGFSFF